MDLPIAIICFPISFSCIIQAFKYRYHLQEASNSLLREAAFVNKGLFDSGITFYNRVCKLINTTTDDPSCVVNLLNFMCDKFRTYWFNTVSSFSKLDTYTSFKCRFDMEDYLDTISNREHRVQYRKIRISNHRLAIETGRFNKTQRNDRLCLYCKHHSKSDIEDEKHILLRCPRYDVYRNELFAYVDELCPRFKELNGFEKFNYLLNSDGPIVKAVARFFYKANTTNLNDNSI